MAENETKSAEADVKGRREFLKTAAQVAVTAPAVAMLLTATTKKAAAQTTYAIDDGFPPNNDLCSGGTFADANVGCV